MTYSTKLSIPTVGPWFDRGLRIIIGLSTCQCCVCFFSAHHIWQILFAYKIIGAKINTYNDHGPWEFIMTKYVELTPFSRRQKGLMF